MSIRQCKPRRRTTRIWSSASLGVRIDKTIGDEVSELSVNRDGRFIPVGDSRESAIFTYFYAPILLHPVSHFFLGFGPSLYVDLAHTVNDMPNRRTALGASSTLGGWF
jgi:hypothetical protein